MTTVMMVVEATAGGTARHVVELALGCRRRGLGVHLVCATRRDAAFRNTLPELRASGVVVDELDMRRQPHPARDALAASRLRRTIVSAEPDVVHLHSSKAGALGRCAVIGLGRRAPAVVYTPHAYASLAQPGVLNRWAYRCAERVLLPWTDRVVAVSASEGRIATRLGGAVAIIPNGVDAERTVPARRREHGPLRVGWLGRMAWQKDPESAVVASYVLAQLGVEHELLLGGAGPELPRVTAAIRRYRAEHSVRVLGYVHDTAAFHAGIDLLLTTSRYEGLPYAALDAMAHGLPIVGFDVPGVNDLVTHGVTGLLAPRGDPGALAAHAARLARDPGARAAMGAAARKRVRAEFRLDTQLDRFCDLYETLAARRATDADRRACVPRHVLAR